MQTGGSSFEQIMEEVLNQQRRMRELEDENQSLRRQLADLSEGRGVFVDIQGQRFAVVGQTIVATSQTIPEPLPSPVASYREPSSTSNYAPSSRPETPLPGIEDFNFVDEEHEAPSLTPEFLQELLLDEVATAATGPVAALSEGEIGNTETSTSGKPKSIPEEEKAALRRDLMGSFLLE